MHQSLASIPTISRNYSDSEDENHGDFETTDVVPGYAMKEETHDNISHLGGEPVGLPPHIHLNPQFP